MSWTPKPPQSQLDRIVKRLERRHLPPSRLMLSRLLFWRSTAPVKNSARPNTASWDRGARSSNRSLLEKAAMALDRFSPGLRLGTRLVWRPWHRIKHRIAAWLLSRLTPVSFNALLALSSRGSNQSPGVTSATRLGRLEPRAKYWFVLIVRRLCRKMIGR